MAENDDIDDVAYRGIRPEDIIDIDSVHKVSPEAGLFAPALIGPMTRSARSYPVYVVERNRGIHRWLCRLGLHAWQDRWRSGHPNTRATYCAVCGVPRG